MRVTEPIITTLIQWYDGALAEAARNVECSELLEPAGDRYRIGPSGRSVQDAYEIGDEDVAGSIPGFHSVSEALRRTMRAEHDVWYVPKASTPAEDGAFDR